MGAARSMLARVRRLELVRTPAVSPFEVMPGGLDAWEARCQAGIDAGNLDGRDVPLVILAVRRWHREEAWAR